MLVWRLSRRSLSLFSLLLVACASAFTSVGFELHVVTYADRATPQLCASARSAARHGIRLHVLDAAGLPPGFSDPRANKPAAVLRYLRSLDGPGTRALFLFADAYDVLYTGPLVADALLRVLRDAAPRDWNASLLFAGERNCSPYMVRGRRQILLRRLTPHKRARTSQARWRTGRAAWLRAPRWRPACEPASSSSTPASGWPP